MTDFQSRAQWGARRPTAVTAIPRPQDGGVGLHYEGPKMGTFPHSSCATKVRGIQAFHMDSRGWGDIAYSGLVCPHGTVYVGRGPGVRTAANGTNSANDSYYALCALIGQGDVLTDAMKIGFLDGIEWLRRDGRAGSRIRGHRSFKATACPGDPVQFWIDAGLPRPNVVLPPDEEDDMAEMIQFQGKAPDGVFQPPLDALYSVAGASVERIVDPDEFNDLIDLKQFFPGQKQQILDFQSPDPEIRARAIRMARRAAKSR